MGWRTALTFDVINEKQARYAAECVQRGGGQRWITPLAYMASIKFHNLGTALRFTYGTKGAGAILKKALASARVSNYYVNVIE